MPRGYRTKLEAVQSAKRRWVCESCYQQYPFKTDTCPQCRGSKKCHHFPSKTEANRAVLLMHMQKSGQISGLKFHPTFRIEINGMFITSYVADSEYIENGVRIIEDVKPKGKFITSESSLKIKLFEALYAPLKVRIWRGNNFDLK